MAYLFSKLETWLSNHGCCTGYLIMDGVRVI